MFHSADERNRQESGHENVPGGTKNENASSLYTERTEGPSGEDRKLRDWMKRTIFLLTAVCLLFVCLAGTAESMHQEIANDAFDMEVLIGYDGMMTYGKVMPIRVRIRNFGDDLEGVLGVNAYISQKEYDRYETEVAVPAGSEREFELAVSVYARQEKYTAELIKDGEVLCASTASPKTLINPNAMLIGVLSTRARNMNNMTIDRDNDVLGRYEMWKTVPLTLENFPESEKVLRSFGILVLDDIDPAQLSTKQQEMLDGWLRSGRAVICGGGSNAGRNISFLSKYTGLKLEEITTTDSVMEGLEKLLNRSVSGKKVTAAIAQYSGAEPLARDADGHGLIWRTEVGGGRIYTTAFETGDVKLNTESLMHYFWQQLLVDQDQSMYSSILYSDGDSASSASVQGGWSTPVMAKSYLLPGLLIVTGTLILSCVLWWILKKRDKRQGMWIVLPAIAVLCVAGIMLLAGQSETNRPMAVITENMVQDASGSIRSYGGISAAMPEFGRHSFSTAADNLRVLSYDYVDYDEEEDEKKRREPDTMRTCYTAGGKNAVTAESVTPWQQINLYSDSSVTFHGKVEGEVWMEENGLHGQIVNGTDVRLGAGKLITSYGWRNLPALDPGGKAEFLLEKSTFKDPKNPQYENGGLYLENPSLYSVVGAATSYDSSKESVTADETASSDLISSMINGASDVLKRMHSNWSYGAYESALFMYCAEPESTGQTELYVDGKPVEQKTCKSLLSAELSFVAVGRTGVVFRSAGMDMPERMETDENLLPMNKPLQSAKQSYYHTLIDNPTFLFALKEMAGVKIESLQVLMDSYYAGQSRVYALNAQTRQWEEISINQDVKNPNRYLDEEGNLYLQFRGDTQDMYADIPTPMINLEGRVDHADN